jgi:hypothetical protein
VIGGIDTRLPTHDSAIALEVAVRAVRQCWPRAVYENADSGDRYSQFKSIPFGALHEIFVYRDAPAADAWDTNGAIPELHNTMIHLIADEDVLTVVVDEKDDLANEIIAAIKSALSDDILHVPAYLEREAA